MNVIVQTPCAFSSFGCQAVFELFNFVSLPKQAVRPKATREKMEAGGNLRPPQVFFQPLDRELCVMLEGTVAVHGFSLSTFGKTGVKMKVKLNLDLDIELTEGGKRIQVSKLWDTAQDVAAQAAESVFRNTRSAGEQDQSFESQDDPVHSDDPVRAEDSVWPNQAPVAPQSLHPLGTFLFDFLERVVEASETIEDRTSDAERPSGPR
jgi:hypothetical protein